MTSRSYLGKMLTSFAKLLYGRAKGIAVATDGMGKLVASYGANKTVQTIFNGYDPELFYPVGRTEKFNRFTLICHGNLGWFQDLDLLLEVAGRCPTDVDLIVIGDGPCRGKG